MNLSGLIEDLKKVKIQFLPLIFCGLAPYRGQLHRPRQEITINPLFEGEYGKILLHELLHYRYPELSEDMVRCLTEDITRKYPGFVDFLDLYAWRSYYGQRRMP